MATAKKSASPADAFETTAAINADAFKEGYEKMTKGMNELADFNRNSLEAFAASAGLFAKSLEKAASDQSAFLKSSYEEGVAAVKAATSSKSVQDALEVQTDYLRSALEKNISHMNKLADHWVSTGKEVVEPMKVRYTELVEKIQSFRP